MMEPSLDLQDQRVLRFLQQLRDAGGDRQAMAEIGRYMKSSVQLRFRNQMGPDGRSWFPSQRAARQGGQTLRDTNRLYRSITWQAGPDYAETGTNLKYAQVHQLGIDETVSVRAHRRLTKRKWAGGASVKSVSVRGFTRAMRLRARPFLGFSGEDKAEIMEILRETIEERART